MEKEIWYSARHIFDPDSKKAFSWGKYIEWSKLTHLKAVVSLDCVLNGLIFDLNYQDEGIYDSLIIDTGYDTSFFNSLDFVLKQIEADTPFFNLIAAIKEPNEHKSEQLKTDFEFVGYDLLDKSYDISALTNCGGFDGIFQPTDLNQYGLVTDFQKVKQIQKELFETHPEEYHADCHLFEVWWHKTIGRKI